MEYDPDMFFQHLSRADFSPSVWFHRVFVLFRNKIQTSPWTHQLRASTRPLTFDLWPQTSSDHQLHPRQTKPAPRRWTQKEENEMKNLCLKMSDFFKMIQNINLCHFGLFIAGVSNSSPRHTWHIEVMYFNYH